MKPDLLKENARQRLFRIRDTLGAALVPELPVDRNRSDIFRQPTARQLIEAMLAAKVVDVVALLDGRQKDCVVLVRDGLDTKTIARRLEMTPNAVRLALKRAMQTLSSHLPPRHIPGRPIAVWVKDMRLYAGLSQQRLASAIGVSVREVRAVEQGLVAPDLGYLRATRDAIGMTNEVFRFGLVHYFERPDHAVQDPSSERLFWRLVDSRRGSRRSGDPARNHWPAGTNGLRRWPPA